MNVLKYQNGKPVVYEPDWSDKVEPYTLKLGLVGDAVGLGTAATGVGVPVGAAIAGVTNLPNLVIDGYQSARDWYRTYKGNSGSLNSALTNTGEFLLDVLGLKILSRLNKARKAGVAAYRPYSAAEKTANSSYRRVGTGAGRVHAKRSAANKTAYNDKRAKALKESKDILNKRGVRESQGSYYEQKLTEEMAKRGFGRSAAEAAQSVKRTARQNSAIGSSVSAGVNTYDLTDKKKQGGIIVQAKSGIHIKKKNRGKFTAYCGGTVTDSCIKRAKASGNPTLVKRATFAANARKWKHQDGGTLLVGEELGNLLGDNTRKVVVQNNKRDDAFKWFKSRYQAVNWDNMRYIYNQMKQAGIPYDATIAIMGNIIHESQGDPNKRQIGGGPGYGLLQWTKGTEPGDTLELQTKGIIDSIINPADSNNYWYYGGKSSGFTTGEAVRQYMNQKNNYEFSKKTEAFSNSRLRPGKPEMDDRKKSSRSLAAITDWFPEYLKGGKI